MAPGESNKGESWLAWGRSRRSPATGFGAPRRGGGASISPKGWRLAGETFVRPKREPGQVTSFRTDP